MNKEDNAPILIVPGFDQARPCRDRIAILELNFDFKYQLVPMRNGDVALVQTIANRVNAHNGLINSLSEAFRFLSEFRDEQMEGMSLACAFDREDLFPVIDEIEELLKKVGVI